MIPITGLTIEDTITIHEIIARSSHLYDDLRVELWDSVFAQDIETDFTFIGGEHVVGIEALAELLRSWGGHSHHNITNVMLRRDADGQVRARSRYISIHKDGDLRSGEYLDILRKTPDGWRIAKRQLVRHTPALPDSSPPLGYADDWLPNR